MADPRQMTDQEAAQWYGGHTPTGQQINNEVSTYGNDPFRYWWDTFVNGNTVGTQALGAAGAGPKPIRTGNEAASLSGSLLMNGDIRNAGTLDALARQGVATPDRGNPFSVKLADQSRAAQMALINQMRAQMAGPSLAGMQGQQAMAQSGQQALRMGVNPAAGRAAMLNAQQVGGGMAGDVARARLAEVMRGQAGVGGMAGGVRGGDIRTADAYQQAALAQAKQDEARRQMYARFGMNLQGGRDQAAANREITRLQLLARENQQDADTAMGVLNTAGSIFGFGMNMGRGKGGAPAPTHTGSGTSHD